jgi:hypothetical protein
MWPLESKVEKVGQKNKKEIRLNVSIVNGKEREIVIQSPQTNDNLERIKTLNNLI